MGKGAICQRIGERINGSGTDRLQERAGPVRVYYCASCAVRCGQSDRGQGARAETGDLEVAPTFSIQAGFRTHPPNAEVMALGYRGGYAE